MRVQEVILEEGKRYILVDREGIPVIPVVKYLKYLDVTGKRSNTQKTYCYAPKQYFLYLQETGKDYKHIKLEDLVEFVGWLRNPYESTKVTSLQPVQVKKTQRTVNLTVITDFIFSFIHPLLYMGAAAVILTFYAVSWGVTTIIYQRKAF